MPKILITGFNKNQCTRKFYLRQQLKVVPSHYSLFNCLTDMGYEVEQRQVALGENLNEYDEVIVFIAGPRQLVATTVYEGLYTIGHRPDCILAFDDWQVPDLFKGVSKCAGNRDELFAQFILDVNKKTMAQVEPYEQHFMYGLEKIVEKKNRMLVSAFQTRHLNEAGYGPELLFGKIDYPLHRLFVYNPNPYHRNRVWADPGHEGAEEPGFATLKPTSLQFADEPLPAKEHRFNFASLVQSKTSKWLKKQGYVAGTDDEQGTINGWAVDLYGSKAETQKRLTEDEMVKVITRDWGCLMPAYDHAGSGWWRARPLQCAQAGSILIGDDKEMRVYYGNEYAYYGLTAKELTQKKDDQLEAIAFAQMSHLMRLHPLDKEVQKSEIQAALDAK